VVSGAEAWPRFRRRWTTCRGRPDLICLFSGYDSHRDDCGAGITNWTNDDFRWLTQRVLDLAQRSTCPVLSVHGGGYQLLVTVAAAVEHVRTLASD